MIFKVFIVHHQYDRQQCTGAMDHTVVCL